MGDEAIIHVRVGTEDGPFPSGDDLERIQDVIRRELEDYNVILSTYDVSLAEIPALDDYADELADRVADRLTDSNG